MRYEIDSEGVPLYGEDVGHGPCVVLLHAGGERRQVWNPVVESLVAKGYRCVTLDQRGHGESGGSRDDLFDSFVRDAERLRSRLRQPAVYVGASLGGLVVLKLGACIPRDADAHAAGLVIVDVLPDPDPALARAMIARGLGAAAAHSPLVNDILARGAELRDTARALTQPLLFVLAARGVALEREGRERMLRLVPHAQQVVIEDCGHLVARERPAALAAVLLDFLGRDELRARVPRQPPETRFEQALALLDEAAASRIPHLAGTLLEHLRRTELWLDRWDAPEHVRLAGLWHAAYGTDGFATALLDDRARLAQVIGERAEASVYRYGACDRAFLYAQLNASAWWMRDRFTGATTALSADEQAEIALITLANELDVARHGAIDEALRGQIIDLLRALAAHKPREARLALNALGVTD